MSKGFTFLPAFARADADVNLLLLQNNVAFTRQVNDTLFLAQNATTFYFPNPVTMFIPNASMSALGCTEQYQLCGTDLCTDPGGYYQFASQSTTQQLNLNVAQNATVQLLFNALFGSQMRWVFYFMGSEVLLARDKIPNKFGYISTSLTDFNPPAYVYSSPLRDNQWHLEAERIHNVAVAILQLGTSRYAVPLNETIRPGVTTTNYIVPPDTAEGKSLCGQQKLRTSDHTSFSVFGLAFIIVTGSIIIILSHTVPSLVAQAQRRSGKPKALYRREEWIQNDVLQLLRVVLTGANDGYWVGKHGSVPVTVGFGKIKWGLLDGRKRGEEDLTIDLCGSPGSN
jgi:hypothetical protein